MKLTITLTPGFNAATALTLAQVSNVAYYEKEEEVEKWARDCKLDKPECFTSPGGDLKGFLFSWKDEGTGGKKAILTFRGSNPINWLRDARTRQTPHPPHPCMWGEKSSMGHVHNGFGKGILALEGGLEPYDATVRELDHLWICGHSLGGALGILAATRYRCMHIKESQTMEIYTFGQPMVGCQKFVDEFDKKKPGQLYQVMNGNDIVPACPLKWMWDGGNYFHTRTLKKHIKTNSRDEVVFDDEFDTSPDRKDTLSFGVENEISKDDWDTFIKNLDQVEWIDGNIRIEAPIEAFGGVTSLPISILSDHSIRKYIENLDQMLKK